MSSMNFCCDEFLLLDTFQAGLSWLTILKKRENFKKAFDHFDYRKISEYDQVKISELLEDAGIIRNRMKIHASIKNAKSFIKVQKEFGSFDDYVWSFVDNQSKLNKRKSLSEIPATTPETPSISKVI